LAVAGQLAAAGWAGDLEAGERLGAGRQGDQRGASIELNTFL